MLRATFVRTVGQPDRIYVTRSDGSEVSWSFPTYGEGLPHDLVHLVVESAFDVAGGFWGRVDDGADPQAINAEANRRGGRDKYAAFGNDRGELLRAEALANAPWTSAHLSEEELEGHVRAAYAGLAPASPAARDERVGQVRAVLALLLNQWRGLKPKGALNLRFDRERPALGFEQLRVEAGRRTKEAAE
jgi:hypothetical protein